MEDSRGEYDWSDLKIVEKVIREYFQEFRHFPSAGEMRQYLPKGIVDGIYRYHGGVNSVRKKLQYESTSRKPSNYWKEWENIKKEISILYKELNNYPKQIDFKRYKLTSLDSAIRLYHGGHTEVAKKLQLEVRQWIISKDGHSCNSYFEKILDDALFELNVNHDREVVFQLGRKLKIDFKIGNEYIEVLMFNVNTAPKTEMEKQYKSNYLEKRELFIELGLDVFEWYPEYFYQFQDYLKKMLFFLGQNLATIESNTITRQQVPLGYWTNFNNIRECVMNLREELGNFPTRDQLKSKYGGGITYAINKQYGGLIKLACKLNIDLNREKGRKYKQEPRYYSNIENVKRDILSLSVEYGIFPTQKEIGKKSVPLDKAIQAFPGGRIELAREIGYPIDSDDFSKTPGYWNNLDNLNNHIKICVHDLGRFPTYEELSQRWGGICQAIYKHYGSLSNCAAKLGYTAVHKPKGYFQNIDNIIRDLLPLCEKFNKFPTSAEIIKNLGGTYSQAIKKLGGRDYFANKCGYSIGYSAGRRTSIKAHTSNS